MKNKKQLQKKADEINDIICSRNLYAIQDGTGLPRRVINCEVFKTGDGILTLTVEDLYGDESCGKRVKKRFFFLGF